MPKNFYIIAGCNGAGKTTASYTILPEILGCYEFVNADEIARGLSPFQPESVAMEAGRIMLERVADLFAQGKDFAIETTLASKMYKQKIEWAQANGYKVTMLYFWLQNENLAKKRVKQRVKNGGHHIPEDVIERRYFAGLNNLFKIYIPLVDSISIIDNTNPDFKIIADGEKSKELKINNKKLWQLLNSKNNESSI
jgi:predicted ABC-type ATPase